MLREAIANCPDEQWRIGENHFLVPARLAFHVIQACDFHLDDHPGQYNWHRFGLDWEEAQGQEFPGKAETLAYLEETKAKVEAWLRRLGDAGLVGPDASHKYFPTALEHALYTLRHLQYHLGQVDAVFNRRGIKSPEWK
jgi:hypothetical protein